MTEADVERLGRLLADGVTVGEPKHTVIRTRPSPPLPIGLPPAPTTLPIVDVVAAEPRATVPIADSPKTLINPLL